MKLSTFTYLSPLVAITIAAPTDQSRKAQGRREIVPPDWQIYPEVPGFGAPVSEYGGQPFTEFEGCSDADKKDIEHAWQDTVELLDAMHADFNKWGEIEKRFFGEDIDEDYAGPRREAITRAINNAHSLKANLHKIPVSCRGKACTDARQAGVTEQDSGTTWQAKITFCPTFFDTNRKFHEAIKTEHKKDHKSWDNGKDHLAGKARVMLHELMHVRGVSPTNGYNRITDESVDRDSIYGWEKCEKYAEVKYNGEGDPMPTNDQINEKTQRNADSYALFAVEKWYYAYSKELPPPAYKLPPRPESTSPKKSLIILLEASVADKAHWFKWLFFSTVPGRDVKCRTDPPFVAERRTKTTAIGDDSKPIPEPMTQDVKTPDGVCQYKNDGDDNAGALWCGSTKIDCYFHFNMLDVKSCGTQLMGPGGETLLQKEAIYCDW